jgi:hypothetical protein
MMMSNEAATLEDVFKSTWTMGKEMLFTFCSVGGMELPCVIGGPRQNKQSWVSTAIVPSRFVATRHLDVT